MSTRLIMFLISVISLFFIISLSRSIYALWQKGDVIGQREKLLIDKRVENTELKGKLEQVESPEFIEQQAREKLNLAREGEITVVLPKAVAIATPSSPLTNSLPVWQQWWQLFF